MKRSDAQRAIDEAFADGLRNLFVVFERNLLSQGRATAIAEFERGIGLYDDAHTAASAVIEKIFNEDHQ